MPQRTLQDGASSSHENYQRNGDYAKNNMDPRHKNETNAHDFADPDCTGGMQYNWWSN